MTTFKNNARIGRARKNRTAGDWVVLILLIAGGLVMLSRLSCFC